MVNKWITKSLIVIIFLTCLIYLAIFKENHDYERKYLDKLESLKDYDTQLPSKKPLLKDDKNITHHEMDTNLKVSEESESELPPKSDQFSVGLGEGGEPAIVDTNLLSAKERLEYETSSVNITLNAFVSDRISVRRFLPDYRDNKCKRQIEDLPNTSVIITFHNELYSLLLRTIHSVLDRSDPKLIKEIILVNDASDYDYVNGKLQNYLKHLTKVKLINLGKRNGLTRARLAGIKIATGDTLTFLDSHCECLPGWLEPLLEQVKMNKTRIAEPELFNISADDFRIENKKDPWVGKFDWALNFWWDVPYNELLENSIKGNYYNIIPQSALVGGVFSIDSEFFKNMGYWDDQLELYGYENIELSFKTWMCGGSIYKVPCSIVGHVYHNRKILNWKSDLKVQKRNRDRVVEVWMDDYKKFAYLAAGPKTEDLGDVQHLKEWRKNNHCHDFDWFMRTVDTKKINPKYAIHGGVLQNKEKNLCMKRKSIVRAVKCVEPVNNQISSAIWYMTKEGFIYTEESCLDYDRYNRVTLFACYRTRNIRKFEYDESTGHIKSDNGCLEIHGEGEDITIAKCNANDTNQRWNWGFNSELRL